MATDRHEAAPAAMPFMFLPVADGARASLVIAPAPLPERERERLLLRHDSREEIGDAYAAQRMTRRRPVREALPWPSLGGSEEAKRIGVNEKPRPAHPRRTETTISSALHAMDERVAAARRVCETPSTSSAVKKKKNHMRTLRTPPSAVALDPLDRMKQQQQRTAQQQYALAKSVETRIDAVSRALPIQFLLERDNRRAFAERVLLLALCRVFRAHYHRIARAAWQVWTKRTLTLRILEDQARKLFLLRQTSLAHACAVVQRHLQCRSRLMLLRWKDTTATLRWHEHMRCAKRIQKCWRAWRMHDKLKILAMTYRERVRQESAVCIQNAVRRFLAHCEMARVVLAHRRYVAAMRIQHAYRNYVLLQIAERYRQEMAARTIQRIWRGRQGRRRVHRRRETFRVAVSRIVEASWLPVALANAIHEHACARRIQRLYQAIRYRQHVNIGVHRAYQRRHYFPVHHIQRAWFSYRLDAVRLIVQGAVFRVVVTHMAAARRIQHCFRTYWKKKTGAAACTLTRLFRRFAVRRHLMESSLMPWIREWHSTYLWRWWTACGGVGAADSRWRQFLAVLLDSIAEFHEDQSSPLRRLQLGTGIRLMRQLKRFRQTFLTARARQIQLAWRWHRLLVLVAQMRAAAVLLRRSIPKLYRQHKRRCQRQRVLQRWKRRRYIELHARFESWKRQYLVRIQARELATTTRNVRKALWFHHHKLRQEMVRRWTRYVYHQRGKRRKMVAATVHANVFQMRSAWRAWTNEALPDLCCSNRVHEMVVTLAIWKTWQVHVARKQLSWKARQHRQRRLSTTAFAGWKQDREQFTHELGIANRYRCYHTTRRAFLRLARLTAKAKQVRKFCKEKHQAYALRHWLESVYDAKRDRTNALAASRFRKHRLARSSWTQWTQYCRHQLFQKEKRRAMELFYERRRARRVISTWSQELVPMWRDYHLIVSVAMAYRARRLKERCFCQGFRVFWEITAGARRVAMAIRIQRSFRSKRARKRILIMRLKIKYQLETRATMGADTRAFTSASLQAALASHEWVFVLFLMPWAPAPARVKEAFCKTATTWSFIRQQGRRMVFGLVDATERLSLPPHSFSLMSWFGLQPDQLPCIVGFWQGVGPSPSSSTDSVCRLATGETRQLKRRFKTICDVPSTSAYALVHPATTKDSVPTLTMSRLVGWIERLQHASREATAIDLQSYLRGFLARRRTKRYHIITMERRKQRVHMWCRKLLARWTDTKRQYAAVVLQVWVRHVQARRQFWIAFHHDVELGKQATHRIQHAARVHLIRLRTRRAIVSLMATPERYPNAPLCQVCLVNSEALARLHCRDCRQVYCAECFAKAHRSGKRLLHLCDSVDFVAFNHPSLSMCTSCEVCKSTRVCWSCGHGDELCTICFEAKHTDEPLDGIYEEKQGKRRSRRAWWRSTAFREHNWKRVDPTVKQSPNMSPLTAKGVMDKYAWQSKAIFVEKQHEAAQADESVREREDKLLAIRVQQEAILRDAFDRYDTDKSGAIDGDEFKRMFKDELCEPLGDALVDEAMRRMDKSGNGLVEFDELLAWFAEDTLAKEESGANQQAYPRSLSMLKDALRAKRQMRRYKEKLKEFVPTVRVPKPQAFTEALLSQLTERKPLKKRTVPGFLSVACLEHKDFARKRKVFYRFVKEICGLDWIDEDESTIPVANAMQVFDQAFVPRWNTGELTYDFYFDDESFKFEGETWQRQWVPETKKYVFTTARRKMRKVDDHTATRRRRKRFSLTKSGGGRDGGLAEITCIEETVEIVEQVDPRRKQMLLEEAQEAFTKADKDASGYIDEQEFHRMLTLELCEPVSKAKAKQIMKQLDADGSGRIDFHEFFQWYAVEKCQEYPMTPQMARARALLQTRRRVKATATAAVFAGISGSRQLKDAVARKHKDQQLARNCKGASAELIALLQEGFSKLLAEKALALHNQDVAFARKWLCDRKYHEQLERDQAARAHADAKARTKKMAREKKQKRHQRITTLRKQIELLVIGPSKKEAHTARMQQALSNLDREIQLVQVAQ